LHPIVNKLFKDTFLCNITRKYKNGNLPFLWLDVDARYTSEFMPPFQAGWA